MTAPIELGFRPSPQQLRAWRLQKDGATSSATLCALRIEGDLDRRALESALAATVARHEILRTAFRLPAGLHLPLQVILEPGPVSLSEADLRDLPPEHRPAGAAALLGDLGAPPLRLEQGEGWRAALVRLGPREHELLFALSAACADPGAFEPLAADLLAAYAREAAGGEDDPEPPLQYVDVAEWQNSLLEGEDAAEGIEIWREHWQGQDVEARIALPLPLEESEPAPGPFAPREAAVPLSGETAGALARLAEGWGCPLHVLILTAWKAVIQRGTGRDETLVGVLHPGRDAQELQGVVGPLARYLPLAARFAPELPLCEAVAQVRQALKKAESWGDYFSWDHVAGNGAGAFGFPVCFEAGTKDWSLAVDGLRAAPVRRSSNGAVLDGFALSLACTGEGEDLGLALRYDPRRFRREAAHRLAGRLATLLGSVAARPEAPLADHPALSEEELGRMLELSVAPPAAGSRREGKTLAGVFEERVDHAPDHLAVVAGDGRLTFRELDVRANRLAHHLRAAGAGPEVPVALCLERSAEAVAAILAVWKAGAFYVPLDPTQPAERLAYLFADTGAPLLVTDSRLAPGLPGAGHLPGVRMVRLDDEAAAIALQPADRPAGTASPENLAYTIYTSGSTGRPKGVQVEHRSALHLLAALEAAVLDPLAEAGLRPDPLLASLNAPMIFDASVQQLALLLAGHALCVVPQEIRADGEALLAFLREQEVDLLDCTPSQLRLLVNAGLLEGPSGPGIVLTAGEAVDEPLWKCLAEAERTVCFNLYGPTECSVDATFHRIEPGSTRPTIGRPLAGYEVFLLDHALRPVPPGAPGELCLGGTGLARGYLCRPDLTAERFVPHPFARKPGERLYRTGDLGRHLPGGDLEFLGRLDHQVKIRGFRIELLEIEAVLGEQAGVREAVVLARESATEDRRLVAYVVGDAPADALRQALRQRLPDYMVPAAFVTLAALPLTPNGKVDRKALPAPEQAGARASYVAPRTREEELLAVLWAQVLRLPRVGVNDNFFELGGDSILSVLIVTRARQAGLYFTVRQIFEHQTVAELAHHATAADAAGAARPGEGPVAGEVPLTPIQRSFFEQHFEDFEHYNHALLLEARETLSPAALERAMAALVEHHDALRMRFHRLAGPGAVGRWRQENAAAETAVTFHHIDLSGLPAPRFREACERAAASLHACFQLSTGPVTRLSLFDAGDERPALLFWVVDHLVVDGVSWRLLLEDLEGAYRQAARGLRPILPPKTTSFQEWSRRLEEHALDPALEAEISWWRRELEAPVWDLPLDHPDGENTGTSARSLAVSLDEEETRALLQEVPAVYRTQINDVLLTALARALAGPGRALRVELEGHGREEIFDGVDLSRTVGWFTTLFPVRIEAGPVGDPGAALRGVKEHLRAIPRRGIGYGVLRWLRGEDAATRPLRSSPHPGLSFNYLGQFDGTVGESSFFAVAGDVIGARHSARGRRMSRITVDSMVAGGRLRINWSFSENLHERSTIETWAERLLAQLRELIGCCREAAARRTAGYAPSDFPLAGIGQRELDRLLGTEWGVEDVFPLSPAQEGMLFHSLFEAASGTYVGQLLCTLRGDHDAGLLKAACQWLADHRPLLRTSLHWQGLERPLQVVHGEAAVTLETEDWRGLAPGELQSRIEELLRADRARGFDVSRAPVMRWRLLRTGEQEYRFLWSHHHALLDGWSFSILVQELLACYEALRAGTEPDLPRRRPYRDYIAWLLEQDLAAAEQYWRRTLAGWTEPTPLAVDRRSPGGARGVDRREIRLDPEITADLGARARGWQVTLNTLLQAAWAILLARYSGHPEVLFGATVSGRPADLAEAESMVGPFINTLPVRVPVEAAAELEPWVRGLQLGQAELRQHQHSPLVKIQEWSGAPRGIPLFESILVFENFPTDHSLGERRPGLGVAEVRTVEQTNYPLTLVSGPGSALLLHMAFDLSRFDAATVERMLGHLGTLLSGISAAPEGRRPSELPLLTAAERDQALGEWNAPALPEAGNVRLHELFESWAERTPAAPAVLFAGTAVSYGELEATANRLARRLRALGVGPESRVGLCFERSPEALAAMLGAMKAGGAYVPLDPEAPRERLAAIAADAGIAVLLTQERLAPSLAGLADRLVAVDTPAEGLAGESPERPVCRALPDNAAYVIYTSGSTGVAKGVVVTHRSVVSFTRSFARVLGLGPDDRLLLFAPLSFDASVLQIFPPLASGAAVVVHPNPRELTSPEILALSEQSGTTVLDLPAALWRQWVEEVAAARLPLPASLRSFLTGGESVPVAHLSTWAGLAQRPLSFLSSYGPTEATVTSTVFETRSDRVPSLAGEKVPLGRPLSGTRAYVLDRAHQPAPCGVAGELFLGGAGLARGYLGRPDLTADAFQPDPFAAEPGERLYRTGDLAVRRPDGELEFLGRADHQVKLRGFRIELGDVESALRSHPGVKEGVVLLRASGRRGPELVAFVVAVPGAPLEPAELRRFLSGKLPDSMVPTAYAFLEQLPTTASGKLDRRALEPLEALAQTASAAYRQPRDPVEIELARIWEELLGVDRVGLDDDFFELGGHSLLAVSLISRIERQLGQRLPLTALFEEATLESVARLLRENAAGRGGSPLVPLKRRGDAPPWFFVHPVGGQVHWYFELARSLGEDVPAFGLQAPGLEDRDLVLDDVSTIARAYLEAVREVQPRGPYFLAGWSAGGTLAFEMARELQARGETVGALVLIDTVQHSGTRTGTDEDGISLWIDMLADLTGAQVPPQSWRETLLGLDPEERLPHVAAELSRRGLLPPGLGPEHLERMLGVYFATLRAVRSYEPQPYPGPGALVRAAATAESLEGSPIDASLGWASFFEGDLEIRDLPGSHYSLLKDQTELLASLLAELRSGEPVHGGAQTGSTRFHPATYPSLEEAAAVGKGDGV